ncbi:MAG TPA: short-chain dehydrogenase/reductase [Solirubrobacteraceae bacterium]|nr:short-chain dehydrogenase/reductase [Solirubrobacteraceae bacterium]
MASSKAPVYDVNGRTVFITGAARGIGKAVAERLHAKGANVALVGLEPERLEQNVAALGDRAVSFEVDVTDLGALERAVKETVERFGAIDVAIANAGIAYSGALATAPVEQVERTLAVNLLGVWRTDRAVISQITEQRGYLLNISSLSAVSHGAMMGPYTTAKSGVDALSDALRMESAPFGAAVGCAYFGFLDTDLVRAGFAEPSAQAIKDKLPGFIGNPAPLSKAIDAIERGIERRSPRIWAPRWVGPMLYLRGVLQPLTERLALKDTTGLVEAMRLAEEANRANGNDSPLGVAAKALD